MKAVFLPGDKRVQIRAVEVPTPGPGEVLVQIKASCICRSDLSLYYGNAVVGGDAAGKCITGHEPAGIIASTGVGVKQFKTGDRVAVYLGIGCGVCPA
jgi:propanol-preferring alcohol dehydrogenase